MMSDITIPDNFICPITLDVMIDPVRTDCPGTSEPNLFQRIYQKLFPKNFSFEGHIFENLALAAHLAKSNSCPMCRHRILKVVKDEKKAKEISEKFIKVSDQNKKYFESVKKDLDEDPDYDHVRDNIVLSPKTSFEKLRDDFYKFLQNPMQTTYEIILPINAINSCIRNDDLDQAEQIALNRLSNSVWIGLTERDKYLKKIAIAYIDRRYLDSNLRNASRIINKIYWNPHSPYSINVVNMEQQELYKKISRKYLAYDNLQRAELTADKMSYSYEQEKLYRDIAKAYINKRYSDSNFNEAKRISNKITSSVIKMYLKNSIAISYVTNDKISKGFDIAKNIAFLPHKLFLYTILSFIVGYLFCKKIIIKVFEFFKTKISVIRA